MQQQCQLVRATVRRVIPMVTYLPASALVMVHIIPLTKVQVLAVPENEECLLECDRLGR